MKTSNVKTYQKPLTVTELQFNMQRMIYNIESVKRRLLQMDADLQAIRDDAELAGLEDYKASVQSLHDLIHDTDPILCHFVNCEAVATEKYNGHDVCHFCYHDLQDEERD